MQIAQVTAAAGIKVIAVDANQAAVDRGMGMIRKSLTTMHDKLAAKGVLTPEGARSKTEEVLSRISTATDRGALGDVDLVIEAVPETMDVKTPVWRDLARLCRKDAILATNTSGLPVKALADLADRPSTVVGLHFFNPVQLMALVEVVKLPTTDPAVVAGLSDFARRIGKTPITVS